MLSKTASFFLFKIVLSVTLYCQDKPHYVLHPSVGDTIERLEKLDYSLFPFLENDDSEMAVIGFENQSYFILAQYNKVDTLKRMSLEQKEIVNAQKNIEKINAFYKRQAKKQTEETPQISLIEQSPNRKATLNAPMSDQMRKDVRMFQRLCDDEIRRQEFINGSRPNQIHIEFG